MDKNNPGKMAKQGAQDEKKKLQHNMLDTTSFYAEIVTDVTPRNSERKDTYKDPTQKIKR